MRALPRAALERDELRILDRELDVLAEVLGLDIPPTPSLKVVAHHAAHLLSNSSRTASVSGTGA